MVKKTDEEEEIEETPEEEPKKESPKSPQHVGDTYKE